MTTIAPTITSNSRASSASNVREYNEELTLRDYLARNGRPACQPRRKTIRTVSRSTTPAVALIRTTGQ